MTSGPVDIPADLDARVKIARDMMCIFSSEDQLQSLSKETMEQIRNTMMRHEQLFKEQVEELHKLYQVQISAMQDIHKPIYCPAKLLATDSDSVEADVNQCHSSVMEKSLRPVYIATHAYSDQSQALSMHLNGSRKPFWMNNREAKSPPISQKGSRREIDLERPPEEYMDEFDYQADANIYGMPGAETRMSDEDPARNYPIYKESKISVDQQSKQPLWFLQPSPPFTTQRLNYTHTADFFKSEAMELERNATEQLKESTTSLINTRSSTSTELSSQKSQHYQGLQCVSNIIIPQMTLNQRPQKDLVKFVPSHGPSVELYSKNSNICSQGSPLSEMDSPSPNHNNCTWVLRNQEDYRVEDPNCSGHGSNSPVSQGVKACGDGYLSSGAIKNKTDSIECEPVPMTHSGVRTEPQQTLQSTKNDDVKPSLSSSVPGSEIDLTEHHDEMNAIIKSPETVKNQEILEDDFDREEERESIAAKILLSFAPCGSHADAKWQNLQPRIEAESSQSSIDSTSHVKKQNQRVRRSLNYSNGGGIVEAVKWTKSVRGRRRRTSRRQR